MDKTAKQSPRNKKEQMMFATRWLQLPIYLGLTVALAAYSYEFFNQLFELLKSIFLHRSLDQYVILEAPGWIDIVMITNQTTLMATALTIIFVDKLASKEHSVR